MVLPFKSPPPTVSYFVNINSGGWTELPTVVKAARFVADNFLAGIK
jgi:hypothetical protein